MSVGADRSGLGSAFCAALFVGALSFGGCADSGKEKGGEQPSAQVKAKPAPDKQAIAETREKSDVPSSLDSSKELEAKAEAPAMVETIQFPSEDGLLLSADLYLKHPPDAPFIVLFHQAGWSRGEYREIAPKLNELGFNCLAVDQRSGRKVSDVENESAKLAAKQKLGQTYWDARIDLRASLKLVRERYPEAKVLAWGSSYSAALVLYWAGKEAGLVDALVSFSPGEYFAKFGQSKSLIQDAAKGISVPVFIVSSSKEKKAAQPIVDAISKEKITFYVPEKDGHHGSRGLWEKSASSEKHWEMTEAFLSQFLANQ